MKSIPFLLEVMLSLRGFVITIAFDCKTINYSIRCQCNCYGASLSSETFTPSLHIHTYNVYIYIYILIFYPFLLSLGNRENRTRPKMESTYSCLWKREMANSLGSSSCCCSCWFRGGSPAGRCSCIWGNLGRPRRAWHA